MVSTEAGIVGDSQATPRTTRAINFGTGGNCGVCVAGGWSDPEPGFRWMIGDESELRLDHAFVAGDYILEFQLAPFVRPPSLTAQRFKIIVNGVLLGEWTVASAARLGFRLPAAALSGRESTRIVVVHPDAARPCDFDASDDTRSLSLSVERMLVSRVRHGETGLQLEGTGGIALQQLEPIVGLPADRFMLNFESLGDNCEFGLVQRRCGAEPVSLLRFSATEIPTLLRGLDAAFEDFGASENVEIRLEGVDGRLEYVVHERRYGVVYHTFRYQGEVDEKKLVSGEPARLAFRVRKFIEDLHEGRKIFVVKRNEPLREDEILPLYAALSSYGRIVLLWMVLAAPAHRSGCVEVILPGLYKGYINRFAPHENAHDLSFEDWLEVCANAYRLSLNDGMTSRMATEFTGCIVPGPEPDSDVDVERECIWLPGMPNPDFRYLPKRPDMAPLLRKVVPMGINCELGLVQRHCQTEPVGLFRFGYTPINGLLAALASRFAGIGEPSEIELRVDDSGEWLSRHSRYGFEFHTELFSASHTEDAVRRKLAVRFPQLARKFVEELARAEKLFVYRPAIPGPAGEEAQALLTAMHRFGKAVLVWIDVADTPGKVGTAHWTQPGQLITAYVDRYTQVKFAAGASLDAWLGMVSSALALARD